MLGNNGNAVELRKNTVCPASNWPSVFGSNSQRMSGDESYSGQLSMAEFFTSIAKVWSLMCRCLNGLHTQAAVKQTSIFCPTGKFPCRVYTCHSFCPSFSSPPSRHAAAASRLWILIPAEIPYLTGAVKGMCECVCVCVWARVCVHRSVHTHTHPRCSTLYMYIVYTRQ